MPPAVDWYPLSRLPPEPLTKALDILPPLFLKNVSGVSTLSEVGKPPGCSLSVSGFLNAVGSKFSWCGQGSCCGALVKILS